MKLAGYFARVRMLVICAAIMSIGIASFSEAQPILRLYTKPYGSDPGIPVPTLHRGLKAYPHDRTRYAGDALCTRMLGDVSGGIVQVLASPSLRTSFDNRGTGFFCANDGRIAVCEHELVDCAGGLEIRTADRCIYTVDIVKHDKKNDICILRVRTSKQGSFQALALGSSGALMHQQNLIAFGFPQDWDRLFMSPGQFACYEASGPIHDSQGNELSYMDSARTIIKARMHCEPGNSGSPVFDVNERVVGIAEAVIDNDYTFITPVADLISDLQ